MIVVGLVREVGRHAARTSPPLPGTSSARCSAQPERPDHLRPDLRPAAGVRQRRLVADRHRGGVERGQRVPPPEGINARRVLVIEGMHPGSLVAGISWLAHVTHATPYRAGVPTVIAQEAKLVFGHSGFGTAMFIVVQAATALILYTGGNTSFNGFPFLASFVAEDAFLPRWLTKRGHRLVFSNGIVVLAVLSCALLAVGRRQRQQPRAVLCDRRLHRRSPWPASAWPSITTGTRSRAGGTSWSSTSSAGRDLADRGADLRRGQVHRGRLAGRDRLRDRRARR